MSNAQKGLQGPAKRKKKERKKKKKQLCYRGPQVAFDSV
jgi:hypothetical protein